MGILGGMPSSDARSYHVGTMGWSYPDWKGVFYPDRARSEDYLAAYAEHFRAVEVDSTFYGLPAAKTLDRWRRITPDGFRFALKCPQEITHERQLLDVQAPLAELCDAARRLEDRLGIVLFQFAASFLPRHLVRLKRLLERLPEDVSFALELRNEAWLDVGAPLLAREHGVAWTISDKLPQLHVTSDRVYLRLLGDHDWEVLFDHVQRDVEDDVVRWSETLTGLDPEVREVFAFVNNHYSGHSPATASRLRELLGLSPVKVFRQQSLF